MLARHSRAHNSICQRSTRRGHHSALNQASQGDLVLIFGDATTRCWKQIITHQPADQENEEPAQDSLAISPVLAELSTPQGFDLQAFEDLVIDERGARLAAEESD